MAETTKRRTALCRGCEAQLEELPDSGTWVDEAGITACIPAAYAGRLMVPHMPFPDGFRGAPQ